MTVPWLMNCPHSSDSWCLECVRTMGEELEGLRSTARPSAATTDLRDAVIALLNAIQMEQHNEDIFKGKWKKGSKAWRGEFVERMRKEAIEKGNAALKNNAGSPTATMDSAARNETVGPEAKAQAPCSGSPAPLSHARQACPDCKGSGTVKGVTQQHGPDDYEFDVTCPTCEGTGETVVAWLHRSKSTAFVITDTVKNIWLKVDPTHVENYTVPLYFGDTLGNGK